MTLFRTVSRPVLAAVLAAGLTAGLAACTTVGPNFERPAPPSTPGYVGAGETPGPTAADAQHVAIGQKVAQDWWSYFQSPQLDQVIRQAVAGSPSLAAADATLAAAQAEILSTRADSRPQVTANAGVAGERLNLQSFGFSGGLPGLSNNPTFALYSVGATVSYALDPFGLNRRLVESAAARAETESRQVDAAYLSLTGNVALQAAQIAALRAEIAVVQEVLADDQQTLELVRRGEAAGGASEAPRVNAQAQLAADLALLPPLQQQLAAARHSLSVLAGKAPADWSPPDFDLAQLTLPAEIPVSLPSELVHERPDILAAEARVHAATADVGVATARLYPNLNLTAGLTQSALSLGGLFSTSATAFNLGPGLTAPLLDGGRRKAERQAAVETARAALATYQNTVLQAFGQVADLLSALSNDDAALKAQARTRDAAQGSLRLARLAYEGGATGLLPVVDAQRQFNTARIAYVRADAARYVHTIQLFAATGSGLGRTRSAPAT